MALLGDRPGRPRGGFRRRGIRAAAGALVALLLAPAASVALEPPPAGRAASGAFSEYQVKAAFLFNFMKFTEWPVGAEPGRADPWILCVLGHDPFDGALEEAVRGRTVGGRSCAVRRLAAAGELTGCHLLFASLYEDDAVAEVLARAGTRPILTVGETDRFERAGGIIRFVVEEERVRFVIDAGAARRAGLRISSRLLSLARTVRGLR